MKIDVQEDDRKKIEKKQKKHMVDCIKKAIAYIKKKIQ
jgi:hypothetical protein